MANEEQLALLKQGVVAWNRWREEHDERYPDLHGADLRQASLHCAGLLATNLSETNLSSADLYSASLNKVNLSGADLSGAKLTRAQLVRTDLTNATLTQCSVYGIALWNVQLEGAIQDTLIITPDNEPTITVDDLEMAQFVSLLLSHNKLRTTFNAVTKRGVLLLGHFGGGGLEILQAVAATLREEKYLPIMFNLDRPDDRTHRETVQTLAGLSHFIIADVSGPSVPPELYATVPHFKIPFVPIFEAGREPFAIAVDLLEYPWVVRPPVIFTSTEELINLIPAKIIAPAERNNLLLEIFHCPIRPWYRRAKTIEGVIVRGQNTRET